MQIEEKLFQKKIIILYGARQVGKTTLTKSIIEKYKDKSLYLNADESDVHYNLENKTSSELKNFIGSKKLVIINEAQRIINISLTLKLLIDNYPDIQIIATGSSSFDISNKIIEPLTGRKFEFHLYPISMKEMVQNFNLIDEKRLLEDRIIYGIYPEILLLDQDKKETHLKLLAQSYLFKDIFQFDEMKNTHIFEKLLQALALQIGSEVSFTEIARSLEIDQKTVQRYIDILEKAFIIFRLPPLFSNKRKELRKLRKIYFYDTGIRNLNPLSLRQDQDKGGLWENFLICERMKYLQSIQKDPLKYFWRSQSGKEINYVEEINGKFEAYEFKYSHKKNVTISKIFSENYSPTLFKVINKDNWSEFVL